MKTTHIISSLIIALAIPLLHSCQKSNTDVVEPTQGEELSGTYKLEKPITISFLVGPNKQIRPMGAVTRAVGDLSRDYTQVDKVNATVNSHRPTSYDETDSHIKLYYDSSLALYRSDWIRNIYIPELRPGDYKVEGVVPIPGDDLSYVDNKVSEDQVPTKVTITFYSLPKQMERMTFLVNSRLHDSIYSSTYPDQYMDLEESYFLGISPFYRLSPKFKEDFDSYMSNPKYVTHSFQNAIGKFSTSIFEPAYLPMYARLYNVSAAPSKDALIASETADGTPEEIRSIYLERAVSLVTITWDRPTDVSDDFDYFIDQIYFAKLPNVGSIIPNNWEGVQRIMQERTGELQPVGTLQRTIPSFWDDRRNNQLKHKGGGVDKNGYAMTNRTGIEHFFTPENLSDKPSTIYVVLSKFDLDTGKAIEPRGSKVFELPFGDKNPTTGNLEVRRNTWYKLHIKFRKAPDGTEQPYIPDPWEDVDIPAEL